MKNSTWIAWILLFGSMPLVATSAIPQQQEPAKDLSWAYPVPDKNPPVDEDTGPRHIPGSSAAFTPAQIDDLLNPPDWFPAEHAAPPRVILHGHGQVLACGSCHLISGLGHPESANLAGLSVQYIEQQMDDFKSGARKDAARMNGIAKDLSEDEAKQASEWFASLKPAVWVKVMESDTIPRTFVNRGRMRLPLSGAGNEALGDRIVELPQDPFRTTSRDPHSGFIAYVPMGSLEKGEKLAVSGGSGKTIGCENCHGEGLKGQGDIPALAGRSPNYLVRQLNDFQRYSRNGPGAQLMQPVVRNLSNEDILDIAAYIASLQP